MHRMFEQLSTADKELMLRLTRRLTVGSKGTAEALKDRAH